MSGRNKEYKVYIALRDSVFHYSSVLGERHVTSIKRGDLVYECINYDNKNRRYYYNRKPGKGGEPVQLSNFVENTPTAFLFHKTMTIWQANND